MSSFRKTPQASDPPVRPSARPSARPSDMSFDQRRADLSEGEDEELMFAFEQSEQDGAFSPRLRSEGSHLFHSIDGVHFERPANPMAAILERLDSKKRGRGNEEDEEDEDDEAEASEEEKPAVTPVLASRKRKTLELPNAPARVIRPVAKRFKSNAHERPITAPACLMGNLSLHRTRESDAILPELEDEGDAPFRSASINIPDNFQPILWPGDAAVSRSSGRARSHSCSSSSSSKSWASGLGLLCRRSLDVASPLGGRFNDLVLHSSAGSYTGS
ncbi:hypothetical protein PHYPSEUDO_013419 [Phytophthora pseudosyringae]|uniref:Uncharacterized protein n=1 Tax=Phytophthora pseudosyringae TaxID=221518 RepID=A0A8T1WID3_9STRA|nr:hypothetical protein PHYPSEUDO_013419 [Phytophthora pseudosyringae]